MVCVWGRKSGQESGQQGDQFFAQPILNSPYAYPARHWELDGNGQPTQKIVENRRRADFITPIPKPRKKKGEREQASLIFDEGKGLSTTLPRRKARSARIQTDFGQRLVP